MRLLRVSGPRLFAVAVLAAFCVVSSMAPAQNHSNPGRETKSFILADGTEVRRSVGHVLFRFNGDEAPSPVIFGEPGDSVLLGSMSLEAVGLILDPFKRELRPLPMMLAPHLPVR